MDTVPLGNAAGDASGARQGLRRLALIALLAVLLGFVMQGLILTGRLAGGGQFSGAAVMADVAQGVTWSLFACLGIGAATLLTRVRPVLAGFVSMLLAPVALAIARSSNKVVASMVGAADSPAILSVGTISALKALEYGLLGWMLALLVQRDTARALPYLGAGAVTGAVFGGAIVALSHRAALARGRVMEPAQLIGMSINELLFPVGCALVIYAGQIVGRNLAAIGR